MDREALEDTGLGSLSEILIDELPQISEGSSNTNSQSSVQNTGLSTIDLRELGTNRTLTLIDGRRAVSNSYSGNYVSLSTIPSGMVHKVEIITGGASAQYGSDAIAGVVNIITQQDKEGFSFKTRGGETAEGGGRELTIDTDYGTEFGEGKGYLFVAASYDRQYGLSYFDRKRAQQQDSWWYDDDEMCNAFNTADGWQCMRDITMADWTSLSDSIPGGVFDEKSSNRPDAGFWYDENGLRNDWHEERYGIDFNQYTMLKVPDEAISGAVKANYELSDDHEAYFQVQYSQNNSFNLKSPESEDECDAILTRDPDSGEAQQPAYATNAYRSIKPEYFVAVGICTHLGCSPTYLPDSFSEQVQGVKSGFFCPCHGSKFDMAGRVFQGVPAPLNLVVPKHMYLSDTKIIVGIDEEGEA